MARRTQDESGWWRLDEQLEELLGCLLAIPLLILQLICWCARCALERLGVRPVRVPWWVTEWLIGAGAVFAGSIIHLHAPAWGAFPPRNWGQVTYLRRARSTTG
jgi:hypothetical protein